MIEIVPLLKGLSPIFLLFLTLALIYGSVRQRIAAVTGSISGRFLGLITGGIIHGLCFGLTAVISMSMGLHLSPGVSVDGRLLMISLSGAYGGVISGIITAGVATVYRLSMDGNALAASLTGILGSLIIGIVFFRQRKSGSEPCAPLMLALMGICLAGMILAVVRWLVPSETAMPLLARLSFPVIIIYPLAVTFMGYIFNHHLTQEKLREDLAESHDRLASLVEKRSMQLRNSLDKQTTLAKAAFEGLMISENGILLEVNHSLCRMSGYKASDLIGRPAVDLIAPRDRDRARERVASDTETLEELFCLRKDGSVFPAEIQARMFDYQGRPTRVTALRDISERKQAEQALKDSTQIYKSLFENNTTIILLIDPESGDIVDANPAACIFYGYDKPRITGMNISDINQLSAAQIKKEMTLARQEKRKYFNFSHRLSSGRICEVEVYSGPVQVHGRLLLCSIIHDISERKAIEAERESLIQKLQKALEDIKTLEGVVPICAQCNKIRDDRGYWNRLEAYIEDRSHASFSHGICPECAKRLYGDEDWFEDVELPE